MRQRLIWLVMVAAAVAPAFASTVSVDLGTASDFGLLGGTITSTGNSNITGDVGATTALSGFPPATATGTVFEAGSPAVITAYSSFEAAFATAVSLTPTQPLLSGLTSNQTFTGNNVYSFATANVATTSGITLTFNAQGNANEIFVIQVPGNFTVNGSLNFVSRTAPWRITSSGLSAPATRRSGPRLRSTLGVPRQSLLTAIFWREVRREASRYPPGRGVSARAAGRLMAPLTVVY